jgi:hypothetical protein
MMAEKKPTKGGDKTHDNESKQRERLGRNHLKILHLKTSQPETETGGLVRAMAPLAFYSPPSPF